MSSCGGCGEPDAPATGGVWGAAIPAERIEQLEEQGKGGKFIAELAARLYAKYGVLLD